MIEITPNIFLRGSEIEITYIRAPGPGGQNVNKVATAVQLRFNVVQSTSLPEEVRHRLIALLGTKLTAKGDIIIKASRYRTQVRNKEDAIHRLQLLLKKGVTPPKKRKKTKPTYSSLQELKTKKKKHAQKKSLRRSNPKHDL